MTHIPMNPRPALGPLLSRRTLLGRMSALAAAGVVGPGLLAACGSDDSGDANNAEGSSNSLWHENWPAYMDEETLDLFRKDSGLDFKYTEGFNDNNEYFAKVQADLAAGKSIGPDIITPTFWLAARLIDLGWVQEVPFDNIPNAANLVPQLRKPAWDPDGRFSLPYASGMTGIAYNIAETGRELTSTGDLFDPAFKGRVGMLLEMRDTVGLTMLLTGQDPATATFEGATEAFSMIADATSSGQIRAFTGNDYMDDLATGNYAACIGWSGDVLQLSLDNPDIRFVIPDEGGMQWSDVMVIPSGSKNAANTAAWMNYLYDPENAARITSYVGYNTPVEGVQAVMAAGDEAQQALAKSQLLFPDAATLDRLSVFANLDPEAEAAFDERFSEITGA